MEHIFYRKRWSKVEQGGATLGWNIYYTGKGGTRWNKGGTRWSHTGMEYILYQKRWKKVEPHRVKHILYQKRWKKVEQGGATLESNIYYTGRNPESPENLGQDDPQHSQFGQDPIVTKCG
jgi:hypothetical protein